MLVLTSMLAATVAHAGQVTQVHVVPGTSPVWFAEQAPGQVHAVPEDSATPVLLACDASGCRPAGDIESGLTRLFDPDTTADAAHVRGLVTVPDRDDPTKRRTLSVAYKTPERSILAFAPKQRDQGSIYGLWRTQHPETEIKAKSGKPIGTVGAEWNLQYDDSHRPLAVAQGSGGALLAVVGSDRDAVWLFGIRAVDEAYAQVAWLDEWTAKLPEVFLSKLGGELLDMDLRGEEQWAVLGKDSVWAQASDGETTIAAMPNVAKDAAPRALAWDGDHVLVATSEGVFRSPAATNRSAIGVGWTPVKLKGKDFRDLDLDGDVLWAVGEKGLVRRAADGEVTVLGAADGLPADLARVFVDSGHNVWLSDAAGRIWVVTP